MGTSSYTLRIRANNKWRKVPNWSRSLPVSRETRPLFWANEAELIVARRLTWRFRQREHDEHLLRFPFTSERAAIYRLLFSHLPDKASARTQSKLMFLIRLPKKRFSKAHLPCSM